MKIKNKIFISLLTVAVLVAGFAVSAFAETTPVEKKSYDSILEYYSQPVFIEQNFDAEEVGPYTADNLFNKAKDVSEKGQFAVITEENGNKFLTLTSGNKFENFRYAGDFGYGLNSSIVSSGLYVSFSFRANHCGVHKLSCDNLDCMNENSFKEVVWTDGETEPTETECPSCHQPLTRKDSKLPVIRIAFSENENDYSGYGLIDKMSHRFVNIDMGNNKIVYFEGAEEKSCEFAFDKEQWYSAEIIVKPDPDGNGELTDTYSIKVTDKSGESVKEINDIKLPDGYQPFVQTVVLGTANNENTATRLDLDDINIWGGTSYRDNSKKIEVTESAILNFAKVIKNPETPFEDKEIIIKTADALINEFKFTTENIEVNAAIETLKISAITVYSDLLAEGIDAIDSTKSYAERLSHIRKYNKYAEKIISKDLSVLEEEVRLEVEKNLEKFENENAELDLIYSNSLEFVDKLKDVDGKSDDYNELVPIYNSVKDLKYDVSIDGVEKAEKIYLGIKSKVVKIKELGDKFIGLVDELVNCKTFEDRYAKYLETVKAKFDNTTYAGVAEALAKFETVENEILPIVDVCEEFIQAVKSAEYAIYITAKKEALATATALVPNIELGYPGVADAKSRLDSIDATIKAQEKSASDYINAVKGLDGLSGQDLKNAIAECEELKKTGNITGVEGITDANIKLDMAKASIELIVEQNEQFNILVSRIKDAKTLDEKYVAINSALACRKNADASFDGVSESIKALEDAIDTYNAEVEKANSAFVTLNNLASDLFASLLKDGDEVAIFANVVAFIKELFK